jgi:hypothetical protein
MRPRNPLPLAGEGRVRAAVQLAESRSLWNPTTLTPTLSRQGERDGDYPLPKHPGVAGYAPSSGVVRNRRYTSHSPRDAPGAFT